MQCHGISTISGSETSRVLFFPTNPNPNPNSNPNPSISLHRPGFCTRIHTTATRLRPISAVSTETSFYERLGISETGSTSEIKQAYKQLARKYHPDVSPPGRVEEYTQRFIRVQEAYDTLSDPRRRELYDRDMAKGPHLAFSSRRRYNRDEGTEEKSEWKSRWQSQLSELKRRSAVKNESGDVSWGARMRRQKDDESDDEV